LEIYTKKECERYRSDDDVYGYEFYDDVNMEDDFVPLVKFFESYGRKGPVG